MTRLNLFDIINANALVKNLGQNLSSFSLSGSKYRVVVDNGEESKVLVSNQFELSFHYTKLCQVRLNLVDTEYYIVVNDANYNITSVQLNIFLIWLNVNDFEYVIERKNTKLNKLFPEQIWIVVGNSILISFNLKKSEIMTIETNDNLIK